MSRFKPYPEYKDSGVEWLGEVPTGWDVCRIDALTDTHRDTISSDDLNDITVFHYSIPVVQQTGTGQIEDGITIDSNKLVINSVQLMISKLNPHKQTIVVAKPSPSLLTVASTEFVPLRAKTVDVRFLYFIWVSKHALDYLLARCESATRSHQRVNPDDITKFKWAWPSYEEQCQIACFLDHETAKIDTLIAEQERLIELLQEKRQAVISHAVTKGLNPDAPMKDSGVEWLGEVPAHWDMKVLKHLAIFTGGGTPSRENLDYWGGDIIWVSPKDMKSESISSSEESITKDGLASSSATLIEPGAVLVVVRSGILKHTIPVALNICQVALNQDMKAIIFQEFKVKSEFFLRLVQGFNQQLLQAWSTQGATVESIQHEYLSGTILPLPPMEEQVTIVRFLATETSKFDTLVSEQQTLGRLLKERRSALISAAVTGKIDVRDWQPPAIASVDVSASSEVS